MTARKPLVIVNGQIEQIQSGDTLNATVSTNDSIALTNDEAGAVVIGTPVYIDADDGYKKARANASGTANVIGLQVDASVASSATGNIQTDGIFTATTGQWDTITGGSGGLTAGSRYYLDAAAAGKLTATATTTASQYVAPVGIAISTTELWIDIGTTVLL
jgi:hypothetical protein